MNARIAAWSVILVACSGCKRDQRARARARPITDVVSISGGEFVGREVACPEPVERLTREKYDRLSFDDVPMNVDAFDIERRPVTCDDLQACRAAGICSSERSSCGADGPINEGDAAIATLGDAVRLCAWRGGRLPTWQELQRALRGTLGIPFSSGINYDEAQLCHGPRPGDACEQTSPDGVIYFMQGKYMWTSTQTCSFIGNTLNSVQAVQSSGPSLQLMVPVRTGIGTGAFHCVRDRAPTGATAAAVGR